MRSMQDFSQRRMNRPIFAAETRGSISVELALVSFFILFPLLAGGWDFLNALSSQSELNAALQSLYYYAWNDPADAQNTTALANFLAINNKSAVATISLPSTPGYKPTLSYMCSSTTGTPTPSTQGANCGTGNVLQTYVTYQLVATVNLPVPIPGIANPLQLGATGMVQIQ